jgi:hypothetical protein
LLEQLKKVDYLLYLAKWIGRISEFVKEWDFMAMFIPVIAAIIGGMFSFMNYGLSDKDVSIVKCVWFGIYMAIKYGLSSVILVYFLWEFCNLCKRIKKWSDSYIYEKKATHRYNT